MATSIQQFKEREISLMEHAVILISGCHISFVMNAGDGWHVPPHRSYKRRIPFCRWRKLFTGYAFR